MSADTSDLSKVDSGTAEVKKRTKSSSVAGVYNITDLQAEDKKITISPETLRLGWKMNTSPNSIEDPAALKKLLTEPPVKKIDLVFPLGLSVTARNLKGVTIKDALDAIHKQFKKKADDEFENPYLKGFEWDPEESWTQLKVHQSAQGLPAVGGKKKKKNTEEE